MPRTLALARHSLSLPDSFVSSRKGGGPWISSEDSWRLGLQVAVPSITAFANVSLPSIADVSSCLYCRSAFAHNSRPQGDYKASLSLTGAGGAQLGCAQLEFTLSSPKF